jgi:hypothetical protein
VTETTTQRTARLLTMSNAQLIMHVQDLALERDELLAALIQCDEAMVYMSEYDIPLCLPDRVKAAIASVKGGAA